MITAHVTFEEHFDRLDEHIDRQVTEALNAGARAMAEVANARAEGITTFSVLPARKTVAGWASGISARNPIWRVFDKGSLGKRTARLKKNRRKDSWKVTRKGTTYTAQRRSTSTGGVAPRNISTPARAAGRAATLEGLRRGL